MEPAGYVFRKAERLLGRHNRRVHSEVAREQKNRRDDPGRGFIAWRRGIIYLYYWHQYREVVTLDVTQEIAKMRKPTSLRDLFSLETVAQADRERQEYRRRNH